MGCKRQGRKRSGDKENSLNEKNMKKFMDPTGELDASERRPLPRLESLKSKTVGLLDISKPRGNIFLDSLETKLRESNVLVKRFSKPTFTRVAPMSLKDEITRTCDAVIEALAD